MFHHTFQPLEKLVDFLVTWHLKDVPAARKTLCLVIEGLDFSGFDRENWKPRNSSEHKKAAKRTLEEPSPAAQQRLCSELGARYSVLQELEYFDCIRYFVVDPMHNLYLGTAEECVVE